jgi:5-methylcytosine-specific restriction protein A
MPNLPPQVKATHPPARPRLKTAERGYNAAWRRCRDVHLREHPLCEECKRNGRAELATEVHHVQALSAGGERLNPANLMSLCHSCHSRITWKETR